MLAKAPDFDHKDVLFPRRAAASPAGMAAAARDATAARRTARPGRATQKDANI
ncbi:hypothetical protein GDI2926 [Gluconacetobacter diazotrophicus PA1 5]|uniref:Uncharacterized protein n=1 Tax=Gluconacetobacter diazotrophicus (strain ATCC 49037 / DSM 5601 / CCUG 37298 / CIP 103539 / LMG 7603 / PAl5) TaxID=272568 RepID=A9HRB6_GLUDA|nr:hypothetical protein GDI2926 [Gluconacetobacter diazotrophicus PA1 5]